MHLLQNTFVKSLLVLLAVPSSLPSAAVFVSAQDAPTSDPLPKPTKFGFLLYPGFELLDVAGPLSVLTGLTRQFAVDNPSHPNVTLTAITQYPGHVSTNETFPLYQTFLATTSLNSTRARDIDFLLVPGGTGSRIIPQPYVDYVRTVYPNLKYLLVVCTGAGIVARSGILDGRKATSNKLAWQWVIAQGPKVNWVRQARWVRDGNIWTTSGVAAGIDGTIDWVDTVYGEAYATRVGNMLEYERWTNASYDPFSDIWNSTKRR